MAKRLNIKALGLTLGIIEGGALLVVALVALLFGLGIELVNSISSLFFSGYGLNVNYGTTYLGSIIGSALGFVDGFIGGVVIAWLYNKLS